MRTPPGQQPLSLPSLRGRKGLAFLPGSYQLAVFALFGVVLLALWPGLLDPIRMASAREVKAALKPHQPRSVEQFAGRLETHYRFGWVSAGRPARERHARLLLTGAQFVCSVIGAAAGQRVHRGRQVAEQSLRFGGAGRVRVRAALEEDSP